MTSELRLRQGAQGEATLQARPRKRLGAAGLCLLLVAALVVGLDPSQDFGAARLPWTLLYLAVIAVTALRALTARVVRFETGALVVERRVAGIPVLARRRRLGPDGVVRVARDIGRGRTWVLSLAGEASETVVLDMSSYRSDLEPMARAAAERLGAALRIDPE